MKRVIEILELAKKLAAIDNSRAAISCIREAIAELEGRPKWETPEQYRERTGEEWPDDWAVYVPAVEGGYVPEIYSLAQFAGAEIIVCATEAGPPPDDWRPEGK
jgi:hypothetical protein